MVWLNPDLALRSWRSGHGKASVPLCPLHRWHWWTRRWLFLAALVLPVPMIVGLFRLGGPIQDKDIDKILAWSFAALICIPPVMLVVMGMTGTRAVTANKDGLRIVGVSEEFVRIYAPPPPPEAIGFAP